MAEGFGRITVLTLIAVIMATGFDFPTAYADQLAKVVKITAKKFEYTPNVITLKKGKAVTLEFTSVDRTHGFNCPDLGIRADIKPGKTSQVHLIPQKTGTFAFHCDVFCGEGHEDMIGKIIVEE